MRKAALALAIIILLIGALDLASPYLTLARLKVVADRHDGRALAGFVDFPSVQASLASQLEQRFADMVVGDKGKSTARTVSGIFGILLSKRSVHAVVTEEMLARLIRGADGITVSTAGPSTLHFDPKRYRVVRASFSDFWVCPANAEKDVALRFHRYFPGWKIVQITLPPRLFGFDGSTPDKCG